MQKLEIPLGYDEFKRIREENFYYVDKTEFIRELLSKSFQANLITRPRRFGKTLTMSMLEDFFDISRDSRARFDGLKISGYTELCSKWMNQWPVVFITMKSVEGLDFAGAYGMLEVLLADLCKRYEFLEQSSLVNDADKKRFKELQYQTAKTPDIKNSLVLLTRMLHSHYGKPVILLIDEYDVPLSSAYENGYYTEMLDIIRSMLGVSLKTNPYLKFAVVTGCLQISRESIFTGMNHFVPDSVADDRFCEHIGFTGADVSRLLADAGLSCKKQDFKEWYDGYIFGDVHVYCPWDVLNYVNDLQDYPQAEPGTYWANTSGNNILKKFLKRAGRTTRAEIERLIAGESIQKKIDTQLTYNETGNTERNLWSMLYLTGYLTGTKSGTRGFMDLRIPNREVLEIFTSQITEWFTDMITENHPEGWHSLCTALENGDAETAEKYLNDFLSRGISIRDTAAPQVKKENFYHGLLLGLLMCRNEWNVYSNREDGDGYSDIHVEADEETAFIIEVKYSENGDIDAGSQTALDQIREKRYTDPLLRLDFSYVYAYGIAFHRKKCRVICQKQKENNLSD